MFLPGEVKKYNLAISVFFGNLKLKNGVVNKFNDNFFVSAVCW